MKATIISFLLATFFAFSLVKTDPTWAQEQQIARQNCANSIGILEKAIWYRRQGMPVNHALDVVDDFFQYAQSASMRNWLTDVVRQAYRNPDSVEGAIYNGTVMAECVENAQRR